MKTDDVYLGISKDRNLAGPSENGGGLREA